MIGEFLATSIVFLNAVPTPGGDLVCECLPVVSSFAHEAVSFKWGSHMREEKEEPAQDVPPEAGGEVKLLARQLSFQ